MSLKILQQDHFQQRHGIVGLRAAAAIDLIDHGTIEAVDLPLDDFREMVVWEFGVDRLPAWVMLGQGIGKETGFLSAGGVVTIMATSVWAQNHKQRTCSAPPGFTRRSLSVNPAPALP